jgi:hypothetical protein
VKLAWGGRTSDVFLTENCGFPDNIIPSDLFLADRGFTAHESVQFRQAKLNIPAFTKGKTNLILLMWNRHERMLLSAYMTKELLVY